jgi:hypothetical protein
MYDLLGLSNALGERLLTSRQKRFRFDKKVRAHFCSFISENPWVNASVQDPNNFPEFFVVLVGFVIETTSAFNRFQTW